MRFIVIMILLFISKIVCAQVSVVAPQISAATHILSNGAASIVASVGEGTFLGKHENLYLGSGFYRSNGFVNTVSEVHNVPTETTSIFPNPSNGKFTLTSNISTSGLIEVYSLTGAKVFVQNVSSLAKTNVDVSQQSQGIYLVKIANATNTWIKRIVVE